MDTNIKYCDLRDKFLKGDGRKKVNFVELWCIKEHLKSLSGNDLREEIIFLIDHINMNLKTEIIEELGNIFKQYPDAILEIADIFKENAKELLNKNN